MTNSPLADGFRAAMMQGIADFDRAQEVTPMPPPTKSTPDFDRLAAFDRCETRTIRRWHDDGVDL